MVINIKKYIYVQLLMHSSSEIKTKFRRGPQWNNTEVMTAFHWSHPEKVSFQFLRKFKILLAFLIYHIKLNGVGKKLCKVTVFCSIMTGGKSCWQTSDFSPF